jgi:phosphatidylserine/phosphatidylglycerophosphate/cardiolipin synthase-like enzyme
MKKKNKYNKIVLTISLIFFIVTTNQTGKAETPPSLLINEVMYHPSENENTNEWIELYNPTSFAIDVNGWTISDGQEEDAIQGEGTTLIPPGGYALITDQGTTVYETTSIPDNAVRLAVDDSTLCGYGLNNKNEMLLLKDQTGTLVDAVEWGKDYDDVPGSPAPAGEKGHSLARYTDVDTDDSLADFYESSTPTPGEQNTAEDGNNDQPDDTQLEEETGLASTTILINELYYHTYSNMNNEFIALFNAGTTPVDLTGWYLTDEPYKENEQQAKLRFPDNTVFASNTTIYITQNASAFFKETRKIPDYEYMADARSDVAQMNTYRTLTMSNTGGLVALIDSELTTVDLVVYGETEYAPAGWEGAPIPSSGAGVVLKRTQIQGKPVDTNTASDWIHPRIYGIGQSEFTPQKISFTGEITTFVSPDSSYQAITNELRKATHSIHMNMYEFTNLALCNELIDALTRNISVTLLLEGSPVGGLDEREKFIVNRLAANGGIIRFLVSDEENDVHARYRFDHAKYLVIDEESVIVESCNWANTGVPKDPTYGNREWGIIIQNQEIASYFLDVFQQDSDPTRNDISSSEKMNLSLPAYYHIDDSVPNGHYTPGFTPQTTTTACTVTPVFSPDMSEQAICDAIDSATTSIYIEQLYIYKNWDDAISPFVEHLINKSMQGIDVKIILDYTPEFTDTIVLLNETKQYLQQYGIEVHFIHSDSSPFTTVHNKGMIIDNTTTLISSINWNEVSVSRNREVGILIENTDVASYYATVFFSDWSLDPTAHPPSAFSWADYKNLVLIAVVCLITALIIIRDWRKRKWK